LSQPVGLNFKSRIPTFSDDASVVEAFKVYHYGVDDYSTQPIPDDSIEGNFRTITTSLTAVNSTIAALGTIYVPRISSIANPNIITPENLNVVPLTVRGVASQSENLQRWQNSNNANLAIVFSNGAISSNSYLNVGATTQSTTTALNVVVGNPAHKGVVVRQSGSQTANPQEWQNSTGDTIATVSPTGYLGIGTNVSSTNTAADIRIANSAHRGITVRSATSQTANIQEWQNSTGNTIATVSPTGYLGIGTNVTSTTTAADIRIANSAHRGITVRSAASQSGNIQEWQNSAGAALSWVNPSGTMFSAGNEVATQTFVNNGFLSITGVQTTTNKTLTSPTINGGTVNNATTITLTGNQALNSFRGRNIYISTGSPSGGSDGDVWIRYT
jgi:hypothetical protein